MINIAFTPIGNAGNSSDSTGYGQVAYRYAISKYEVNLQQYIDFLNSVATTPTKAYIKDLYSEDMNDDDYVIENTIVRSGSGTAQDPYQYSVATGPADSNNKEVQGSSPNDPVPFINWFDAARFINWLHNGATAQASTETGAYTLNGATSGVIAKNADAKYWLPTENEWYKAAYYDPSLNQGAGGYWVNATRSDTLPDEVNPPGTSSAANYNGLRPEQYKLIDTGSYSFSPSSYGTFDQAGNLWEWTGTNLFENYIVRGGSWSYGLMTLESTQRRDYKTDYNDDDTGFRIATFSSPFTDLGALPTPNLIYSLTVYEQISALYIGLLDRKADGPGFQFWLRTMATDSASDSESAWRSIADSIGRSPEAKTTFAALNHAANATEAEIHDFIQSVYQGIFSRQADPAELAFWTDHFVQKAADGQAMGSMVVDIIATSVSSSSNADHMAAIRHAALGIPQPDWSQQGSIPSETTDFELIETADVASVADLRVPIELAFVPIINANNVPDLTGYGDVDYNFSIGKYEVTLGQYVAFLNNVLALEPSSSDAYLSSLYQPQYMSNNRKFQDTIDRKGAGTPNDPYVYSVSSESSPNAPVPWVTWYSAARFVNWLHNGADENASTETGAYELNGALEGLFKRTAEAKFWLPSENEWYKAAYYDPQSNLGSGGYWDIATGSDAFPASVNPAGGQNAANYNDFRPSGDKLTPVGAYTYTPSSYGTFDQAGNLWEFLEASFQDNHIVRGGSWSYGYTPIESTTRRDYVPQYLDDDTGFRIATHVSPYVVVDDATGLSPHFSLTGHEQISMLYLGLLDREADGPGYHYWLTGLGKQTPADSLESWISIADSISSSEEAQQTFTALAEPQHATQAQIQTFLSSVYQSLFSRDIDTAGLEYWTGVFEEKAKTGPVGSILVDIAAATANGTSASDHLVLAYNAAEGVPEANPVSIQARPVGDFVT